MMAGDQFAPVRWLADVAGRRASMHVVVDVRMLSSTGIGRYLEGLLGGMRRCGEDLEVYALAKTGDAARVRLLCGGVRAVDAGIYTAWEQLAVVRAVRNCGLLHVPHYNVPILYRGKLIVTVQDITHLTDPAFRKRPASWLYARPMLHLAVRKAAHIFTPSEYSRKQLVERLGVRPEKLTVTYYGVGPEFRPTDRHKAASAVKAALRVNRPYVLYVGNLKPHKNLGTLLRAFAELRFGRRWDHQLVVIGDDPRGRQTFLEQCIRLRLNGAVRHVPWVAEDLLPQIYAAADLLVLPSTSEGFGFPVLEAMACGTPVVCSRAASLLEVGGDAAVYFDPHSVEELADAIDRVLASPTLQAELRERGLTQAAKFSWDDCARKHREVYQRVLAS